jgi:8-oxo-dGTP pyrophosphatase MutT (NUDIX family)
MKRNTTNNYKNYFCNNCGMYGHTFNKCAQPITSIGIIAYRLNPHKKKTEYLLIKRKDSLGFVDLIRGKYNVKNSYYLQNIVDEMTLKEKHFVLSNDFNTLWTHMWNYRDIGQRYQNEKNQSCTKFELLMNGVYKNNKLFSLRTIIENSHTSWIESEWGFPKGRRNYKENDIMTAMREFEEETGIKSHMLYQIQNLLPFNEIFTGSNFKSYKSRYFLCNVKYEQENNFKIQKCEVSDIGWFTYEEVLQKIRDTHESKIEVIKKVHQFIQNARILF